VVVLAVLYFGGIVLFGKLTRLERNRVIVIFLLFVGAAIFWSGFEQAGSSMNLFAERLTDRFFGDPKLKARDLISALGADESLELRGEGLSKQGWVALGTPPGAGPSDFESGLSLLASLSLASATQGEAGGGRKRARFLDIERQGPAAARVRVAAGVVPADSVVTPEGLKYPVTDYVEYGWVMPASWLQSVNPLFIITLAPLFGSLWVSLARRDKEPSLPVKFFYGLFLLGVAFTVLAWGALYTDKSWPGVSPMWLVVTYFLQTCGELCLSPVGLSSITKLAPKRLVGQMMGTWFMGAALGNLIAGLIGGQFERLPLPKLFFMVAVTVAGTGLLFLVFSRPIKKLIGGKI